MKERIFIYDKEKTIELGNQFDEKMVSEFMEKYDISEFEARCALAEMYLNQAEDELILKQMEERRKRDTGKRYTLEEVKKRLQNKRNQ